VDEQGNVFMHGELVGRKEPNRPGWAAWGLEAAGCHLGRRRRSRISPREGLRWASVSVVFADWHGIHRCGWFSAFVSDGSILCVECGVSIVMNEAAYKHTGDLGTYCQLCALGDSPH
jgi:hypothetical protein